MSPANTRIAVVGMACRYPDAVSPDELWQTVLGGRRAFRHLPEARTRVADYRGEGPDSIYSGQAGVLRDWEFDRSRFHISGPLYRAADHTHWLALETAADALADAGFPDGDGLERDRVGVVLGNSLTGEFSRASALRLRWPFLRRAAAAALAGSGLESDAVSAVLSRLENLVKDPFPEPGDETLAGALSNTIAGRICNHFDFRGTGYTVDGACSSSLLAVMTACRALADGDLSLALAGGWTSAWTRSSWWASPGWARWPTGRCASTTPTRQASCPARAAGSSRSCAPRRPSGAGCASTRT